MKIIIINIKDRPHFAQNWLLSDPSRLKHFLIAQGHKVYRRAVSPVSLNRVTTSKIHFSLVKDVHY